MAVTREVQILAFNDFHGNLEPPGQSLASDTGPIPVGGAAYLATALKELRTRDSITVAAGDLISASPLTSSLYYDEPTIKALSDMRLSLASVGNHEFDRGWQEVVRMQTGGCRPRVASEPRVSCKLEPFAGAGFQYLAANVVKPDGQTLFPGTTVKDIGGVRIGFIGMTLRETGTLVSPASVAGVEFRDEAETANAAVPALKAAGANAIVLLIHQGGSSSGRWNDPACPGFTGDILPILARLDPAIELVVSGHTHNAYICRMPMTGGGTRLLTSAGKYGSLVTDIRLRFGPDGRLAGEQATQVPVQGEAIAKANAPVPLNPAYRIFPADAATAALVARYHADAATVADRPVGRLSGPIPKNDGPVDAPAAAFIADGQLFVARDPARGGAQLALMNTGGSRTDLVPGPDGVVTYGKIFAMQPFANSVVTLTLTGAELKQLLEQQFDSGSNSAARPNYLMPSANFRFEFDRSRPAGQRILSMTLNGKAIDPARDYRVAVNNFMAAGGDNFTVLEKGRNPVDGGLDLDATEAYLRTNPPLPKTGRLIDRTPADWKP
ncbi:MAG TPA: 5'-nucleotidase C-terminal domain-containing protein [Sphingomicrobium sp.]|nr:5'-nucleotidase C-terminal domain-containing protein [Sphingomicrobium sp.]